MGHLAVVFVQCGDKLAKPLVQTLPGYLGVDLVAQSVTHLNETVCCAILT
jgi:hypothetical protein